MTYLLLKDILYIAGFFPFSPDKFTYFVFLFIVNNVYYLCIMYYYLVYVNVSILEVRGMLIDKE